jgi:hypothetical protein
MTDMNVRRLGPLALCSILFLAGCPSPTPVIPGSTPLSAKEAEALEAIQLAFDTSREHGGRIWPGFELHGFPLLIFRPGARSFAVNPGFSPARVTRVDDPRFSEDFWVLDSTSLPYSAGLPFARNVEWQGHRFFLVRHQDIAERKSWLRLVVHEIFHEWQQQWTSVPYPVACRYPYEDGENAFLARAEELMLAKMAALQAAGGTDVPLAEYLASRSSRYAREGGATASGIEEWEERIEGTARYVEEEYAVAAGIATPSAAAEELVRYFKTFRPGDLQKWKYYRVGLALGKLLDGLDDRDWKEACSKGLSPYRSALDLLSDETLARREDIPRLLAPFQGERQAVDDSLAAYLGSETDLLAKWKTEGDTRIELTLPARGTAYYSNRGVTVEMADCFRLATGTTSYVDFSNGLEITSKGVATRNSTQTYEVIFHADTAGASVVVDGVALGPESSQARFERSVSLRCPGFKLDGSGPGMLSRSPGLWRVRVDAP